MQALCLHNRYPLKKNFRLGDTRARARSEAPIISSAFVSSAFFVYRRFFCVLLCFFLCLFFCLFCRVSSLRAQSPTLSLLADSTADGDSYLRSGVDKIANTALFRADIAGNFPLVWDSITFARLALQGRYRGSAIRTTTFAQRDDADFLARYSMPFSPGVSLVAAQLFSFSADSRSIGLNRLAQIGAAAGVEGKIPRSDWQPFERITLRVMAGGEHNEQLNIADAGWTILGGISGQRLSLDNYDVSLEAGGFFTNLSNARLNSQWNTRLGMTRSFEDNAQLEVSASYMTIERDFYTTIQQDALASLTTETRLERLFRFNGRFVFPIFAGATAEMQGYLENWAVGRRYNAVLERAPITAVQRDVDQLRFSFQTAVRATLRMDGAESSNAAGFSADNRNEANRILERFPLRDAELQALRSAELQRDNVSARWTLWAQSAWALANGDSVRGDYSTSLLQYDTPSPLNNDDRDELTINAHASYSHSFSHILRATLSAEVRLAHVVFIKAQRSAQNNWNRIFRLSPSFAFSSGALEMRPQFEVLANYTSFDFEDVLGTVQSFSLRQIAYRDSVVIQFNPVASLESRILFRYFERGEFRWNEFTETPRDKNIEAFARSLFIVAPADFAFGQTHSARIGVGGRLYILTQEQIAASGAPTVAPFVNRAFAPETLIELDFHSGAVIRASGWYEFQFDNVSLVRSVPNFLFSVQTRL